MNRRRFLKTTAGAAGLAAAVPTIIPSSALGADGAVAPSNRITMGCVGVGGRGTGDMRAFLNDERMQVVAVCDVDTNHRERAKKIVNDHYAGRNDSDKYKGCNAYNDFREITSRPDIDSMLVATPDHWHAIVVIAGAKRGKDIYCEKPLSLTIQEGRAMSDTVHRHGCIFQTGSQQRSDYNFRVTCELARNGYLGELHTVRCGLPGGGGDPQAVRETQPIPEGFDYNFWLGPAPWAAYHPNRCHWNFRWILDYSGGQLTDWGGHHPDIAQWGMGTEDTGPVEIRKAKGEFAQGALYNTARDYYFEAIYANGVKLIISNRERGGVTFEGTEGWAWANRGRHDAEPKSLLNVKLKPNDIHLYRSNNHHRNFVDCVLSRKEPIAPVETAHRSITLAHLGNIAMRLQRDPLRWDPDKEEIIGDPEAARLLDRAKRAPWHI